MATRKSYAYQIKGNKISLLENQFGYGSGQDVITVDGSSINHKQHTLDEIGPTGKPSWVSPDSDVTNGIEVEYAYSPTYSTPTKRIDSGTADTYHLYNGWFVVDGYLTIGQYLKDWVNDASIAVDSYILIEGSDRWNGIHKVKAVQDIAAGGSHGGIQTYTKVEDSTKYFTDDSVSWVATADTITGVSSSFSTIFSASPSSSEYIWIAGSDAFSGINNGLVSGWSYSTSDGGTIDLSSATSYKYDNLSEGTQTVNYIQNDGAQAVYIYEGFRENGGAHFYSGVSVLEDESFELDLPPYLSKALVYYVKAKFAEDQMDIEKKEYLMREFKRLVEKHESAKISGPRRIMGFGMTR